MPKKNISPTGKEIFFPADKIIVSKTDLKGKITYANALFEEMSGYSRDELMGQPHNLIRHPDMPHCIFKFFWDTLQQQKEIFAYVINMHRNGDHYWVLAHVVPTYDPLGNHIGYHSSRRCPDRQVIEKIQACYAELCVAEKAHQNPKQAMQAGLDNLTAYFEKKKISYGEYIFSLKDAA